MRNFVKQLIRLYSKSTETSIIANMNKVRYFPNRLPDFSPDEPMSTPKEHLEKTLQHLVSRIETNFKPSKRNSEEGGLYVGSAGVAYMFYHLAKNPKLGAQKVQYLTEALEYLKPNITAAEKLAHKVNDVPSFILGNCGVYAVAAALFQAISSFEQSKHFLNLYHQAAEICKKPNFLNCGSDELFVGRAGYVLGALWLAKETNTEPHISDLHDICKMMVASGRQYSAKVKSNCPLMYAYYNVEYLGAAHGLCTILQALISTPGYLRANEADARDIKTSVNFLLSTQDDSGNFPAATDEIGGSCELVHWCHGAGGMVYLMAKAYLTWKEDRYLNSCEKMGELIWNKGLLKKGPGICHGVAGNGYVFLLLFRLTKDPKYLHRALAFAKFLDMPDFKQGARIPDCPYSLYEGIAGTACYIADLLNPDNAAFPFLDIF